MEAEVLGELEIASGEFEEADVHFVTEIDEEKGSFFKPERDVERSGSVQLDIFSLFEEAAAVGVVEESEGGLDAE